MIRAESIQASRANGVVLHTLVCEFPLTILNQLLTHRAFSRNSSSARAVPVHKAIDQMLENPAEPIWTGKQAGMQGTSITDPGKLDMLNELHKTYMSGAINSAMQLDSLGVHKQNAGRYLTPFQNCRIVLSATDWANWDWLRDDEAAQPEIQELARAIKEARDNAEVMDLEFGELHVPFVKRHRAVNGEMEYFAEDDKGYTKITAEEALKVSMSCCAQTSYRKLDTTLEKAENIIPKLFEGKKVHASPSEHQAHVMEPKMVAVMAGGGAGRPLTELFEHFPAGVTGVNLNLSLQSGNFTNWIQHRQLLENHDYGITSGEHAGAIDKNLEEPECTCGMCNEEDAIEALNNIIDIMGDIIGPEAKAKNDAEAAEMTKEVLKDFPTQEEFEKLSPEEQDKVKEDVKIAVLDKINEIIKNASKD